MQNRRDFLITMGLLTAGGMLNAHKLGAWQPTHTADFVLPPLPFGYADYEAAIDARTMEIHHAKHHQAYINNLNKAVTGTAAEGKTLAEILPKISQYPMAVRNNAGGHFNHSLFWSLLLPHQKNAKPSRKMLRQIKHSFGSFADFQAQFEAAAAKRFGSGWVWLVLTPDKKLVIGSTPNQDNPLMDVSELKGTPILCLDVWEHAYYLRYQNKRADYAKAFWQLVNWEKVETLYQGK